MANTNNNNNNSSNTSQDIMVTSFRQKATFMRNWKPASAPSNRDKLELYALHKQAVAGDAPLSLATQSPAERAKYQAWRKKSGLVSSEAMRLYLQEADRQVRVYGTTAPLLGSNNDDQNPQEQPSLTPLNTPSLTNSSNNNETPASSEQAPRGLAAIPLLCAAASESRQAYLRRLAHTHPNQAWWGRQEPLTATPGSFFAIPEALLIGLAALVEWSSLTWVVSPSSSSDHQETMHDPLDEQGLRQIPAVGPLLFGLGRAVGHVLPTDVWRSFWWPAHNSLLALWMAYILVATALTAAVELAQTVAWGSRRTGWTLDVVWKEQVVWCAQSVSTLTEPHQPLSARLVGLALWPYTLLVSVANALGGRAVLGKSILYSIFLCGLTWWYWLLVLPGWGFIMWTLSVVVAGNCFAMIELAGA